MDYYLFQLINNLAGRWPILDLIGIFFAVWLQYFIVGGLLLYAFLSKEREQKKRNILMVSLVLLGASAARFVIAAPLHHIFFRPRPFVDHIVHQLISYRAVASSFPSGHASFFFGLTTAFYFFAEKINSEKASHIEVSRWVIILLFFCAILISLSRIFVGVHYPGDIIIGALVGIFGGWLTYYLFSLHQNKKAL